MRLHTVTDLEVGVSGACSSAAVCQTLTQPSMHLCCLHTAPARSDVWCPFQHALQAVIAEQNALSKGRKLQQRQQLQQLQLLQQENARLQQKLDQRACDMALQQHEMTKLREQVEEQTSAAIASKAMEAALRRVQFGVTCQRLRV